jgi:hypothetical protein
LEEEQVVVGRLLLVEGVVVLMLKLHPFQGFQREARHMFQLVLEVRQEHLQHLVAILGLMPHQMLPQLYLRKAY